MRSAKRLEEDLRTERMELWERPFRRLSGVIERAAGRDALHACVKRCQRHLDREEDLPTAEDVPDEIADSWGDWREGGNHQIPPPATVLLPVQRPSPELWDRARAVWREEESVRLLLPLAILRCVREEYGDATRAQRHELAP